MIRDHRRQHAPKLLITPNKAAFAAKAPSCGWNQSATENQRGTESCGLRKDLWTQTVLKGREEQGRRWRYRDSWGLRSQGKSFSRKVHLKHFELNLFLPKVFYFCCEFIVLLDCNSLQISSCSAGLSPLPKMTFS